MPHFPEFWAAAVPCIRCQAPCFKTISDNQDADHLHIRWVSRTALHNQSEEKQPSSVKTSQVEGEGFRCCPLSCFHAFKNSITTAKKKITDSYLTYGEQGDAEWRNPTNKPCFDSFPCLALTLNPMLHRICPSAVLESGTQAGCVGLRLPPLCNFHFQAGQVKLRCTLHWVC